MTWQPCAYARRWPELWAPLTPFDRWCLSRALADPLNDRTWTRQDICDLIDVMTGKITDDEYECRAAHRAIDSLA